MVGDLADISGTIKSLSKMANYNLSPHTKEELFKTIRELTRDGYFFKIENYYQGGKSDRAAYMVTILAHKSDA